MREQTGSAKEDGQSGRLFVREFSERPARDHKGATGLRGVEGKEPPKSVVFTVGLCSIAIVPFVT